MIPEDQRKQQLHNMWYSTETVGKPCHEKCDKLSRDIQTPVVGQYELKKLAEKISEVLFSFCQLHNIWCSTGAVLKPCHEQCDQLSRDIQKPVVGQYELKKLAENTAYYLRYSFSFGRDQSCSINYPHIGWSNSYSFHLSGTSWVRVTPPCVLRTALFWHCVLRTAIFWPRVLRTV